MSETTYPLTFAFRDMVSGRGFFAGVLAEGRATLTQEDGGYWMSGVYPAAIGGGGRERAEAFQAFRTNYRGVLFDIAAEAADFAAFRAEVERFFNETNDQAQSEWSAARELVRSGSLNLDDLPRITDVKAPAVQVFRLQQASPEANHLDGEIMVALAEAA